MINHQDRDHALLSASGAHRWLACTPSALLESQFPDTTSEAAKEGTLAHELAELKLRHFFFTSDFGKRKFSNAIKKLKENPLWKEEMQGHTDEYLDYVRSIGLGFPTVPSAAVEKKVDLSHYIPDGFGTADCVLISGGKAHIIDFKYGKGVPVNVVDNPQLKLYALGVYEAYKMFFRIDTFVLHIFQPRLPNGASEWEISLSELLEFGEYVKDRASIAITGGGDFAPDEDTCRFCRARATCYARAEKNVELAFAVGQKPPLITPAEVGEYLLRGMDIAKWLADLQEWALKECLNGGTIPGWKAVEGRGSRDWKDLDTAFAELEKQGINQELLWERKPLTVAQAEKVVGKKDFETFVGVLIDKKPGKPTLVKESDKRPQITNVVSAADAFKDCIS